jgi:Flp pilus assembly protein TadB
MSSNFNANNQEPFDDFDFDDFESDNSVQFSDDTSGAEGQQTTTTTSRHLSVADIAGSVRRGITRLVASFQSLNLLDRLMRVRRSTILIAVLAVLAVALIMLTVSGTANSVSTFLLNLASNISSNPVAIISIVLLLVLFTVAYRGVSLRSEHFVTDERLSPYVDSDTSAWREAQAQADAAMPQPHQPRSRLLNLLATLNTNGDDEPRVARNILRRLQLANLPITVAEYAALFVVCALFGAAIGAVYFPTLTIAPYVLGICGYFVPRYLLHVLIMLRQSRLDHQFRYALDLWIACLNGGYTLRQSMETIANTAQNPLAFEFDRINIEMEMGASLSVAVRHAKERTTSRPLQMALEMVYIQSVNRGALVWMLTLLRDEMRRRDNSKTLLGFLVYGHDLLLPLVIGIVALHALVLNGIFSDYLNLSVNPPIQCLYFIAFAVVSTALIIAAESGKRMRRIEAQHQFPRLRSPFVQVAITLLRIGSFILFIYLHTLSVPFLLLVWAWVILICTETPYAAVPIFVAILIAVITLGGNAAILPTVEVPNATVNSTVPLILVGASVVSILLSLIVGRSAAQALSMRLAQYGDRDVMPTSLARVERELAVRDRILRPVASTIFRLIVQFDPAHQVDALRKLIRDSGTQVGVGVVALFRLLLAGLLGYSTLIVLSAQGTSLALIWVMLASVGGYFIPWLYLRSRIRARRRTIRQEMPDVLLLLQSWIMERVTLEKALRYVAERWHGELPRVFGGITARIQLGMEPIHAYVWAIDVIGIEEYAFLSAAFMQYPDTIEGLPNLFSDLRETVNATHYAALQRHITVLRLLHKFAWWGVGFGVSVWLLALLLAQ